jgi:antitoxin YefM
MDVTTYTAVRSKLASAMTRVCEDHDPLIVTRIGHPSVVMMSLDDYRALEETAYLLRSPANAARLMRSIEEINAGKATVRELIE